MNDGAHPRPDQAAPRTDTDDGRRTANESSTDPGSSGSPNPGSLDPGSLDQDAPNRVRTRAGKAATLNPALRAVFMGTPDFAAVILDRLIRSPHVSLQAVYTQPDRPAGRGKKLTAPPVKSLAARHGLPVLQPLNFKAGPDGDAAVAELAAFAPDVLLVAAYGLILPRRVLDIPQRMPVNVHASLLPLYRGAAPIQRAIMDKRSVTGVTIMRMEAGLDTGPMLLQRAVGIDLNDTAADLHDELAREGADLLEIALERLRAGSLAAIPQDDAKATYAPKLAKDEGLVDFSLGAEDIHALIRGVTPWPTAQMVLRRPGREDVRVQPAPGIFPLPLAIREAHKPGPASEFGTIVGLADDALLVRCATGVYAFTRLRPAGKAFMDAASFANGYLTRADGAFFSGK